MSFRRNQARTQHSRSRRVSRVLAAFTSGECFPPSWPLLGWLLLTGSLLGCSLLGCSNTPTPATPASAQSIEHEIIDSLKSSAQRITELATTLEQSPSAEHTETAVTTLLQLAQSLLDNTPIVRGCAKWARYQNYEDGASFAKYQCEQHYEKERLLQLGDALTLLAWHPTPRAVTFAQTVVQDIRVDTKTRMAAIVTLDTVAQREPGLANEVVRLRQELTARQQFYADNRATLAALSDNLKLCFTGRDRDLDVIFEVNPYGDIVRIHSPEPNSRLERCVIGYTLKEEFEMRATQHNLMFRLHVTYRSNI